MNNFIYKVYFELDNKRYTEVFDDRISAQRYKKYVSKIGAKNIELYASLRKYHNGR